MLILIELGATLLALLLAFLFPAAGSRMFGRIERKFAALARRRALAVIVVGLSALAIRAAFIPVLPKSIPRVDDEFSYLLAGETFAHGRLTNPTPHMWTHFETFHELMQPSYQSKYPPGQGLALAAGLAIAGKPILGIWLSVAAMCAAICWMLQEWISPEWALLGGWIAVLRYGVFSSWVNSFWGGAVAAVGGALVLGALPRMLKSKKPRDAVLMGIGLAILANSRPYEGLIFSLPVAIFLLIWLLKKRGPEMGLALRRVVLPLFLMLAVTAIAMGYYNWRVGGDPFQLPYQEYDKAYDPVPAFVWGSIGPMPAIRHAAMREFITQFEIPAYKQVRSLAGAIRAFAYRGTELWLFFLGPVLTFALVMALVLSPKGLSWRSLDWKIRFLLIVSVLTAGALIPEVYGNVQYAAPLTCVVLALVLFATRYIRAWRWRGKPTGLFLSRTIPLIVLFTFALCAAAATLHINAGKGWSWAWYDVQWSATARARINDRLANLPGRDLVLVRYHTHPKPAEAHIWPHVWVFNGPDIEKQKIVWAWGMGPSENAKLIRAYPGRRVWLVDLVDDTPKLTPYQATASQRH